MSYNIAEREVVYWEKLKYTSTLKIDKALK
jgi:hypothetical protein